MADTHEPGSRPPRAVEIRTGLREKYSDVYTPEALHAIEALAAFDDDRKQVMTSRTERRAARYREHQRITENLDFD